MFRPFLAAFFALALFQPAQADEIADSPAAKSFRAACLAKAQIAAKNYSITAKGKDGWLFFAPELRHVGMGRFWGEAAQKTSQSTLPENADPLPAILDFKKQLDKAGIELLMVPVPPKSIVYPEKIVADAPTNERLDPFHQEFYALLRENGVAVLDLTPEFIAQRDEGNDAVYCRQDTHWSGRACVLAARQIAKTIGERDWLKNSPNLELKTQWKRVTIDGDLWQTLEKPPARESLPLRFVGTSGGKTETAGLKPVETSENSPILLLGDSHDLVFHDGEDMHTRGAGLADQLAAELGIAVDLIAVRGSGATPARLNLMRRANADKNYLAKKKLVIWCFSAREFTETAGWQKLPVVP